MNVIIFQPGTHGNFLSRCLSVASGIQKDFDFFSSHAAHAQPKEFNNLVHHCHEHVNKNVWCYIHLNDNNCIRYKILWHGFIAGVDSQGETGVDLLQIKNWLDIDKVFNKLDRNDPMIKSMTPVMEVYRTDNIIGLREFLKKQLHNENRIWEDQKQIYKSYSISNTFDYDWFYNWTKFKQGLITLLTDLGYQYKVDIEHRWKHFNNKKQCMIKSLKVVEQAFLCYTKNISMDISHMCLYEQAYLDCLLEQFLGYEIENWIEYPKNTQLLKPIKAY